MRKLLDRFEEKYTPEPNSGCWLWHGAIDSGGYGKMRPQGRAGPLEQAHRISWRLFRGNIPDGKVLDHLCRVRCCVNPEHLEITTRRENCRRGLRGRLYKKCINGHEMIGDNIGFDKKWHRFCRTCHRERQLRRDHERKGRLKKEPV